MIVHVQNLTKRFPRVTAVDGISFDVAPCQTVGILGPNGAGKTTTLQILAGYLPASGGEVRIAGHDGFRDSLAVRERIGYLPENVPLYTDMRVCEYLGFRGRLKGLSGRRLRRRMQESMEQCGLVDACRSVIGRLSRGYRQRVGLADAILAEPPLLILDEPTVGLDPNQIRLVRDLIRKLAEHHAILLASHILPEVEMVCDRVLIMQAGRIVADGATDALLGNLKKGRVVMELRGPRPAELERALLALAGVEQVSVETDGDWLRADCACEAHVGVREACFRCVSENGWTLRELHEQRGSLEDVFTEVTYPHA